MNRLLNLSQKVYAWLLAAYPRAHRERFGHEMRQLFEVQCRDAWAAAGSRGLLALWLRTGPDFLKTSAIEHFCSINTNKAVHLKLHVLMSPKRASTYAFIAVFLIVSCAAALVTFTLPVAYAATCRIKVLPDALIGAKGGNPPGGYAESDYTFTKTTIAIIESEVVLSNVVAELDLNTVWGKQYYAGKSLKTSDTIRLLKRRLEVDTVRNTRLLSITAYSDDRKECAAVANAVGAAYQKYRLDSSARPALEPVSLLRKKLQETSGEIAQTEADLSALGQKLGIKEISQAEVDRSRASLAQAKNARAAADAQLASLKSLDNQKLREALPTIAADARLTELMSKLDSARQELATLKVDYAPTDMHIVRVRSAMDEINQEIDARVAGIMSGFECDAAAKRAALVAQQAAFDDLEAKAEQASVHSPQTQPYWDKKAALAGLTDFKKAIETKLAAESVDELPGLAVEFTDYAQPAEAPVRPNRALNLTGGLLAAIFLGLLARFLARATFAPKIA